MQLNRHNPKQKTENTNMTTLYLRKSISRPSLRRTFPLIPLVLICFGLSPIARAVVPAPDGGYAGNNTAEGTSALFSLVSGIDNAALGFQALYHNTNGNYNTAEGFRALFNNTTGFQNTANGVNALFTNSTGDYNTANGVNTLYRNTTGYQNTATGAGALQNNTIGHFNTSTGYLALYLNSIGNGNTANGWEALLNNTTGDINTANGLNALAENTVGSYNTANGANSLNSNTTGFYNTANGAFALYYNTTGGENTATGEEALYHNTGNFNTANGVAALYNNTTGGGNTADGDNALYHNTTGSGNTALGNGAGFRATTGSNNVYIGINMLGVADESDACYIRSIFGQTSASGIPVLINSSNKLGTATSSKRFKEDIKLMDKASEALFSLKPVSFRYKKEIDFAGTSQLGLVAEEVEKVNPDLIVRDKEGKPYSVRYDQVNAMLLNEFLKEHRKVEEQERAITQLRSVAAKQETTAAQQQKEIQSLTVSLKEQAAQIRNVSARVEVSRPAPQVVADNQ
jgi:hypothetical protein